MGRNVTWLILRGEPRDKVTFMFVTRRDQLVMLYSFDLFVCLHKGYEFLAQLFDEKC